jgi:hypothetical protein
MYCLFMLDNASLRFSKLNHIKSGSECFWVSYWNLPKFNDKVWDKRELDVVGEIENGGN